MALRIVADLVMQFRSAHRGGLKAAANLYPLYRLQAEQSLSQAPVQLAIPMDVAAQTHRQTGNHHLDHATQGVAARLARIDLGDDGAFGLGIGNSHRRLFGNSAQLGHWEMSRRGSLDASDTGDVA